MRTKEEIANELSWNARIGTLWTNGKTIACVENVDSTGIELSNGYCPNWYEVASQWEPVASYLVVQDIYSQDYLVGINVGHSVWNDDISRAIQYIDTPDNAISLRKIYGPNCRIIQQSN